MQAKNFLQHLFSNPTWISLDNYGRGILTQIIGVALSNNPEGYLPSNESLWRKISGLPQKKAEQKKIIQDTTHSNAILCSSDELNLNDTQKANPSKLLEILWENQWKPAILELFEPVTPELIVKFPQLHKKTNGLFLTFFQENQPLEAKPPIKQKRTKRILPTIIDDHVPAYSDMTNQQYQCISPLSEILSVSKITTLWGEGSSKEHQHTIWELGVQHLEPNGTHIPKARSYLGKQIKLYGEALVAEAISKMVTRKTPVAEPYSFLTSLLNNQQNTKPKYIRDQEALERRSGLIL